MKKNNYVQQLRADNPVFIVWKKIPLSMKLLFVFCFCFVWLLCANDSYAQRTMISVKAQNLTVKEVLSQIEAQSDFSFFYNDHHIDVDRRVSVVTEQSNIFTLLNEVFFFSLQPTRLFVKSFTCSVSMEAHYREFPAARNP